VLSGDILEGTYFVDVCCQGRLRLVKLGAEFIEHGQKRSGIRGLGRRVMCWLWLWSANRWLGEWEMLGSRKREVVNGTLVDLSKWQLTMTPPKVSWMSFIAVVNECSSEAVSQLFWSSPCRWLKMWSKLSPLLPRGLMLLPMPPIQPSAWDCRVGQRCAGGIPWPWNKQRRGATCHVMCVWHHVRWDGWALGMVDSDRRRTGCWVSWPKLGWEGGMQGCACDRRQESKK
jgi:hypothetical protein